MKNISIQTLLIGILAIMLTCGAATVEAATFTVTKSTNSNDGVCDADCSLREAVAVADSFDTVAFSSSLVGQTFTLGGSEIVIFKRIIIDGFLNDPNVAFISGSNTSGIFRVQTGGGLDLRNAILVQGNAFADPNIAGDGGAIFAEDGVSVSLNRVSVRGNTASTSGAISLGNGTHHIINSSFTGNSANSCTAIANRNGNLFMANVTVSGNFDSDIEDLNGAGAICNGGGNLTIRNSTIAYNSSRSAGGIFTGQNGSLNIGNTIVAQNTVTVNNPDIGFGGTGTITSVGGNLIGNVGNTPAGTFTQPNDITGVNPLLAPTNALQGGHPVTTHPLQAGSPARNGGRNQNAVDPLTMQPLTTDARGVGFPRIAAGTVDIGAFEDQSGNTSLVVSKNANTNDLVCDVDCSLREAVFQASLNFGTDTITFAANVFGTAQLGGTEIVIQNQNVNIIGYPTLNSNTLIISGGNTSRIFRLNNATLNISGMTLSNGNGTGGGGTFGGAILAENNSNLTLDKITVSGNFAAAYGAIFLSGGTGRIINSTISTNSANTGLAIGVSGTLNMANTTVTTNLDADGGTGIGAIFVTGTANIRNSTIAFNRTPGGTGGGILNAGTLNLGNTIVSNNIAAFSPDIHQSSGTITSVGGNLVQSPVGFPGGTFGQPNDATGIDPLLAALTDNGGPVTTHALPVNSPAVNNGVNANAVDPFNNEVLNVDARGFMRIVGGIVDKGAFESLIPSAATVTIGGRVTVGDRGLKNSTVVLTDSHGISRTARTGSFGYYAFDSVEVGETYILSVMSKQFTFTPRIVTVTDELTDLDFSATE